MLLGKLRVPRLLLGLLAELLHGRALLLHHGLHLLVALGVLLVQETHSLPPSIEL